jgi:hypothetical protein
MQAFGASCRRQSGYFASHPSASTLLKSGFGQVSARQHAFIE